MQLSYGSRQRISNTLLYILVAVVLIIIAFPVYWLISTSVKPGGEVAQFPPVYIPSYLSWENYLGVLNTDGVTKFLANSVIVALVSTLLTIFLGAMAAYALSKSYLSYQIRRSFLQFLPEDHIFGLFHKEF